jgi:hypothetical protein
MKLARRGQRHPDDLTALIAYGWALSVKPDGWNVEDSLAKRLVQILPALIPFVSYDIPSGPAWLAAVLTPSCGRPGSPCCVSTASSTYEIQRVSQYRDATGKHQMAHNTKRRATGWPMDARRGDSRRRHFGNRGIDSPADARWDRNYG